MAIFVRGLDHEWYLHGARVDMQGPFGTEAAALLAAVQAAQELGAGAVVRHRAAGTAWLAYWSYGDPVAA